MDEAPRIERRAGDSVKAERGKDVGRTVSNTSIVSDGQSIAKGLVKGEEKRKEISVSPSFPTPTKSLSFPVHPLEWGDLRRVHTHIP